MADAGYKRVFDPDENRTRVWDKSGFQGYEPGNTESKGSGIGPINTQSFPHDPVATPGDPFKTVRDYAADIVPSAVTMAAPEIPALRAALGGMSPLKALLAKLGISGAAGTATDQALNVGQNKPILNSAVDSGINSLLGIGVPEMANVGLQIPGITRTSVTSRTPTTSSRTSSGSSNTSGTSLSFHPEDTVTITRDPDTGKFIAPRQIQVPRENQYQRDYSSSTQSERTTEGTTQAGISTTQRDVGLGGGMLAHALELLKNVQSVPRTRSGGAPMLSPLQSALLGLGINAGTDYEGSK